MITIIPMAGRGMRFADSGYDTPKPLIDVAGELMVAWAMKSLAEVDCRKLVFIAQRDHEETQPFIDQLRRIAPCETAAVLLDGPTEGQLCTILAARDEIDTGEDVLVACSDTFIVSPLGRDIRRRSPDCHGLISVADLPGERWSFARTDRHGNVVEVAEKVRISNHASTGFYYFAHGRELVAAADEMIRRNERTRGEFYVIPVYQKLIDAGLKIGISIAEEVWDMGTPAALKHFLNNYPALAVPS